MTANVLLRIFSLVLIGSFTTMNSSLAEERCAFRSGYPGTAFLNPNRHFAGMFRILLNPPDLRDPAAVRRHLVLSETWADIIMRQVPEKSGGLCGAIILPEVFPEMRVSLIVYRTASQIDREKSICTRALEDSLRFSLPNDDLVKRAAKRNALFNQPAQPDPGATTVDAGSDATNILLASLPSIYEKGSLLHLLSAVEWTAYASVDAAKLRAWIQGQRSPERAMLESISHCLPPRGDIALSSGAPPERSEAGILPAGEINLTRSPGGPVPAGPLRYAVVVGDPDEPPSRLGPFEVDAKYCGREHVFSTGDESSPYLTLAVRPRCATTGVYDLDSWTMIYCDPADCTSEGVEQAVMSAIASDPEVLDFARRSSNTAIPRGPYLVTIK